MQIGVGICLQVLRVQALARRDLGYRCDNEHRIRYAWGCKITLHLTSTSATTFEYVLTTPDVDVICLVGLVHNVLALFNCRAVHVKRAQNLQILAVDHSMEVHVPCVCCEIVK